MKTPHELALPGLRLHAFLPRSRANGPGWRSVVWVQGCSLGCPGCFNPATHPFSTAKAVPIEALLETIIEESAEIEGITFSGGEPLQQAAPLARLATSIKARTSLSILLFTGFGWDEIQTIPGQNEARAVIRQADVVIAGRYDATQRTARGLVGSANKTVHFLTPRYSPADFAKQPEAEVVLEPDGTTILSGIDPLFWPASGDKIKEISS